MYLGALSACILRMITVQQEAMTSSCGKWQPPQEM
jgi:hypothetical protein